MRIKFKLIFIVLVGCVSLYFMTNAWCLTDKEEEELMKKINSASLRVPNHEKCIKLLERMSSAKTLEELCRVVIQAPMDSINISVIDMLWMKIPNLGVEFRKIRSCMEVVNNLVNSMKRNDPPRVISKYFDWFKKEGMDPPKIHARLIYCASIAGNFHRAKILYAEAKRNEEVDGVVFSAFMAAAVRANDLSEAERVFIYASKRGFSNVHNVANLMSLLASDKYWKAFKDLYHKAEKDGVISEYIYSLFVKAYGRCSTLNIHEVEEAFHCARGRKMAGIRLCKSMIRALTLVGRYKSAMNILKYSVDEKIAGPGIFKVFIIGLSKMKRFTEASKIFKMACDLGFANRDVYKSMLIVALNCREYSGVRRIFMEARNKNLIDAEMCKYFMEIALIAGDIKTVFEVYRYAEGSKRGLISSSVIAKFIFASAIGGDFNSVEMAFNKARRHGLTNKEIINSYICALIMNGEMEKAEGIFLQFYPRYRHLFLMSSENFHEIFDLRGCGFGAAYILLSLLARTDVGMIQVVIEPGGFSERAVRLFANNRGVFIRHSNSNRLVLSIQNSYDSETTANARFSYDLNRSFGPDRWQIAPDLDGLAFLLNVNEERHVLPPIRDGSFVRSGSLPSLMRSVHSEREGLPESEDQDVLMQDDNNQASVEERGQPQFQNVLSPIRGNLLDSGDSDVQMLDDDDQPPILSSMPLLLLPPRFPQSSPTFFGGNLL